MNNNPVAKYIPRKNIWHLLITGLLLAIFSRNNRIALLILKAYIKFAWTVL